MKAQVRFEKLSRDATYRHRLRVHAQSVQTVCPSREESEEQRKLGRQSKSLLNLTIQHKSTPDEALRVTALSLLESFPRLSRRADPNFVAGQRLVRAIAHFKPPKDARYVRDAIDHHVQHAYVLDAQAAFTFAINVSALSAAPADVLRQIDARIAELSGDFLPYESLALLAVFGNLKLQACKAVGALALQLSTQVDSLGQRELCDAVRVTSQFASEGQKFAATVMPAILEHIPSLDGRSLGELSAGLSRFPGVPRRVMTAIGRRSIAIMESLTPSEVVFVLSLFNAQSFRHERVVNFGMKRLVSAGDAVSPYNCVTACAASAHFFQAPHEFAALAERAAVGASRLNGGLTAALFNAIARFSEARVSASTVTQLLGNVRAAHRSFHPPATAAVIHAVCRLNLLGDRGVVRLLEELGMSLLEMKVADKQLPPAATEHIAKALVLLPKEHDNLISTLSSLVSSQ